MTFNQDQETINQEQEILEAPFEVDDHEMFSSFLEANANTFSGTNPVSCSGTLAPFDDVRRGDITSDIIIAKNYYFGSSYEGTIEERRAKLDAVVSGVFKSFIKKRTLEYEAITCHYRGVDWNKPGGFSWKTLTCQPGFTFVRSSLKRTQNGDWKKGPVWGPNNTTLSWATGGHRRSETFAEVDAVYFEIDKKVIEELNSARKVLHDLGIPTELPTT